MSDIRANTISNAAGTGPIELTKQSAAKAWINFNGTGTVAIRDSFNSSSLTDHNTGDYTLTFSNELASGNFAWSGGAQELCAVGVFTPSSYSSTVKRFNVKATNSTVNVDAQDVNFSLHGDLA